MSIYVHHYTVLTRIVLTCYTICLVFVGRRYLLHDLSIAGPGVWWSHRWHFLNTYVAALYHRNQTINRKGAYIISRRPSHGQFERRCCPQAFLRIFSEVTYIRTVGNSTLLKIYTLPNPTITIGNIRYVYFRDTTPWLITVYGGGASFVQKWSMPWMAASI
jgi:hypothetical protein